MAGGEGWTVGRDDDRANPRVVMNFPERGIKLGDQALRQTIAGFRPTLPIISRRRLGECGAAARAVWLVIRIST
jgi:hypothetical protein